MMNNTRQS